MPQLTRSLLHLANVAGFALGLAVASMALFHLFGPPREFRDRMGYFSERKDSFDVVFVGSSVTKYGIDPKVFDKAMLDAGVELRSFNMGIAGAWGFELDNRIREILAMKPKSLRWIFIEPRLLKLVMEREYSDRDVWWHSARQTGVAAGFIDEIPVAWREKYPLLLTHFGHMAARYLNVGKGSDALGFLIVSEDEEKSERQLARYEDLEESAGYWRLTDDYIQFASPGMIQLANAAPGAVAQYEMKLAERVAELDSGRRVGASSPPYVKDALRDQVEFIGNQGIQPIYILPPGISPHLSKYGWVHTLFWESIVPEPLAFDDPRKYPDLYAVQARFDDAHLNEHGATAFSKHLARKFAARVERESR